MEKMPWDGGNVFFLANPDIDDILGRADLDFEFFVLLGGVPYFWISQVPRFPKSGLGQAGAGLES